jgi:hypothetical protein
VVMILLIILRRGMMTLVTLMRVESVPQDSSKEGREIDRNKGTNFFDILEYKS